MIGIGKGMVTTMRQMLRPAITLQYPTVRRELPERARMSFRMATDENGGPQCKACLLCERSCPDDAIKIESEKNPDGPGRILTRFTVDLGRCMYCGLCVEQCTSDGLHHTGDFENAVTERSATMLVLYETSPEETAEAAPMREVSEAELEEVKETFGHTHPGEDS